MQKMEKIVKNVTKVIIKMFERETGKEDELGHVSYRNQEEATGHLFKPRRRKKAI